MTNKAAELNPDLFDYASKRQAPRKPPAAGRVYLPGHRLYAEQQRVANPPPIITDDELNDEIGF
jgi:hypothetical protein